MINRISTALMHTMSLSALQARQSEIQKYQKQIASGVRLQTGADDPAGIIEAKQLEQQLAALEQYQRNGTVLGDRLRQQETALSDAGDALQRARELAIQSGSGTMNADTRHTIAQELRGLRQRLLQIANREDGHGRRLFAGTQDSVQPFVESGGSVSYVGNSGQNTVDVASDNALADTDPGDRVFMAIPTGDGVSRTRAAAGNTGSGRIESAQVVNPTLWNGTTLQLQFTSPSSYQVVDGNGNPLVPPVNGPWTPGQLISAQGAEFVISGAPNTGDTFVLEKAPQQDVFATLAKLADALDTAGETPADRARRDNALRAALEDIDNADRHLLSIRTDTGIRLAAIDNAADIAGASHVTLSGMLAKVRDTDMADAVTRLQYNLTVLEATQKVMTRTQGSSLFDRL